MAYIVGKSAFNPFSFQELLVPLQMYSQEYKEQEAAYDALTQGTAGLESLQYSDPESEEYQAYKSYMDDLNAVVDKLSTGDLRSSRQSLINLKRRFTTDILQTQEALKKREELDKEWRATSGRDSTWIGGRPRDLLISDIKKGKYSTDYGVSGLSVKNDMKTAAAAASSRIFSQSPATKDLFNQYIKIYSTQGLSSDDVAAIMDSLDSNQQNIFTSYINGLRQAHNYDIMSDADKIIFDNYIKQGIFEGAGYKETIDYKQNLDLDRAYKAAQIAGSQQTTGSLSDLYHINLRNIYSRQQVEDFKSQRIDPKLAQHFTKNNDGTYSFSYKEYDREPNPVLYGEFKQVGETKEDIDKIKKAERDTFNKKMSDLASMYGVDTSKDGWEALTWQKYNEDINFKAIDQYDALKSAEVYVPVSSSEADDVKNMIFSNVSANGKIQEVEFNADKGTYINTNNSYTSKDLKDFKPVATTYSDKGNTAILENDKGERIVVRYKTASTAMETSRDYNFSMDRLYSQAIIAGVKILVDANGNPYLSNTPLDLSNPSDVELLSRYKTQAIKHRNAAYLNHSLIHQQGKTENQKFK